MICDVKRKRNVRTLHTFHTDSHLFLALDLVAVSHAVRAWTEGADPLGRKTVLLLCFESQA